MLNNSLAYYSILWLLSLVGINCITVEKRLIHTATLIGDKLYILNGRDAISMNPVNDFFYLDFSVPFNTTQQLFWQDLSSVNTVPSHYGAASVKGGAKNDTLFLYGGMSTDTTLVYTFDPHSETWSSPEITGANDVRKQSLTGIIGYNGKMYLWGGESVISGRSGRFSNDMLILDTVNLNWETGSSVGAPTPRRFYGATLLPNQNIIYIGGRNSAGSLALNEVYLYDTIHDNWSTITTSGTIPSKRDGFSVVLGLDGQRIIMFGGSSSTNNDAIYVLSLNDFKWYIPRVSGQIPDSRFDHKANVIGKYMVVSFGNGYYSQYHSNESDILLLDISNNDEYIWTYDFIPQNKLWKATKIQKNTKSVIIGTTVGSLVCIVLLGIGIFLWNKNKRNQKKVNPVHFKHENSTKKDIDNERQVGIPQINEQDMLQAPEKVVINKNSSDY